MSIYDDQFAEFSAFGIANREAERVRKLLGPASMEERLFIEHRGFSDIAKSLDLGLYAQSSATSVLEDQTRRQIDQLKHCLGSTKALEVLCRPGSALGAKPFDLYEPRSAASIINEHKNRQLLELEQLVGSKKYLNTHAILENSLASGVQAWQAHGDLSKYLKFGDAGAAAIAEAAMNRLSGLATKSYLDAAAALHLPNEQLQRVIDQLQSPWARYDDYVSSASGLAQLNALVQGVRVLEPFEPTLGGLMRYELGDFRDNVSWDESALLDAEVRVQTYWERGFRPEIADFSSETLGEFSKAVEKGPALTKVESPFSFAIFFNCKSPDERRTMGFECISTIERQVRTLIDQKMTAKYGPGWVKARLQGQLREAWTAKQEAAVRQGRPKESLIHYADFTDYELIITGGAAWTDIFAGIFGRKEDVRESFQRLNPLRVAIAHSRDLVNEDVLILVAEGTRLMRAMTHGF